MRSNEGFRGIAVRVAASGSPADKTRAIIALARYRCRIIFLRLFKSLPHREPRC
ncbi:hypothetical protein J7M28_11795 [bacterium]|nr:hypothetical protein [bacterium]